MQQLYDRAILNRAALRAIGYTRESPDPPGGLIERCKKGNPTGLLIAKPKSTCSCSNPHGIRRTSYIGDRLHILRILIQLLCREDKPHGKQIAASSC